MMMAKANMFSTVELNDVGSKTSGQNATVFSRRIKVRIASTRAASAERDASRLA